MPKNMNTDSKLIKRILIMSLVKQGFLQLFFFICKLKLSRFQKSVMKLFVYKSFLLNFVYFYDAFLLFFDIGLMSVFFEITEAISDCFYVLPILR